MMEHSKWSTSPNHISFICRCKQCLINVSALQAAACLELMLLVARQKAICELSTGPNLSEFVKILLVLNVDTEASSAY